MQGALTSGVKKFDFALLTHKLRVKFECLSSAKMDLIASTFRGYITIFDRQRVFVLRYKNEINAKIQFRTRALLVR